MVLRLVLAKRPDTRPGGSGLAYEKAVVKKSTGKERRFIDALQRRTGWRRRDWRRGRGHGWDECAISRADGVRADLGRAGAQARHPEAAQVVRWMVLRVTAAMLVLAGIGVAAAAAWTAARGSPDSSATVPGTVSTAPPPTSASPASPREPGMPTSVPVRLVIPAIGVDAPLIR